MTGTVLSVDGGLANHIGGVDYDDELFATMTDIAGEAGSRVTPPAG